MFWTFVMASTVLSYPAPPGSGAQVTSQTGACAKAKGLSARRARAMQSRGVFMSILPNFGGAQHLTPVRRSTAERLGAPNHRGSGDQSRIGLLRLAIGRERYLR